MVENFKAIYKYPFSKENVQQNHLLIKFSETKISSETNAFKSAIKYIQYLYEEHREPLYVCLSGGVDSTALAMAFVESGVNFKMATLCFKNNLNIHDLEDAYSFSLYCKKPLEVHQIDIDDYFSSGQFIENVEKYRCSSPQFAAHFELLKRIDGIPILPWQPPLLLKLGDIGYTYTMLDDHYLSYQRFFDIEKRKGIPYFFLSSSDMILNFLKVGQTVFSSCHDRRAEYPEKVKIYNLSGFDVKARAAKYTGFELYKSFLESKYGPGPWFETLFRSKCFELAPTIGNNSYLFPKSYLPYMDPRVLATHG